MFIKKPPLLKGEMNIMITFLEQLLLVHKRFIKKLPLLKGEIILIITGCPKKKLSLGNKLFLTLRGISLI